MPCLVWHLPSASANPQVRAYAEMICGINLNTAEAEDPEIKQRCISGLVQLGTKALKVSGVSIQRCKSKADFFWLHQEPHLRCQSHREGGQRACRRDSNALADPAPP